MLLIANHAEQVVFKYLAVSLFNHHRFQTVGLHCSQLLHQFRSQFWRVNRQLQTSVVDTNAMKHCLIHGFHHVVLLGFPAVNNTFHRRWQGIRGNIGHHPCSR